MKVNMNVPRMNPPGVKVAETPAAPTPEKTLPPALTPEGANPATSGIDAAPSSLGDAVKALDEVLEPKEKTFTEGGFPGQDKNAKVEYKMPARGCRFRFVRGEYVLGELDSLKNVIDWVIKNEVDPTKIEVLDADNVWINFDKVKK